jgi:hypothetical protein
VTDARRLAAVLLTAAAGFFALGVALEEGEGETVLGLDVESTATVAAATSLSPPQLAGPPPAADFST